MNMNNAMQMMPMMGKMIHDPFEKKPPGILFSPLSVSDGDFKNSDKSSKSPSLIFQRGISKLSGSPAKADNHQPWHLSDFSQIGTRCIYIIGKVTIL
jgi:hypothetical protein